MKIERGQVAVITGGASGIGLGLARRLGRRGLSVVIADVRPDGLDAAVAELTANDIEALGVPTDVRDPAALEHLAARTLDRFGRVDLVCNNAGIVCPLVPMWEQELESWRWLIDVKLLGVVHGVRAFAPLLLRQGVGHILNTGSSGGMMPLPGMTPYNATMHAVVGLTETLNLELRARAPQVGASVLAPGLVATGLGANTEALRTGRPTEPSDGDMASAAATFGEVMSPDQVADETIAGIESDRVHIVVGAGIVPLVRARAESVLADLPV